jgi:SAM-dependent methyltransferase
MPSCCCDPGHVAAGHFSDKIAARDLDAYRREGPGITTRLLLDGLRRAGAVSGSLLDVGAGIGALTFELLEAGVARATAVDPSPAYVSAAWQEAARRRCVQDVRFVERDFLAVARDIPPATIVTLDRVICCYPDYAGLLRESLKHAEGFLALSYPRDTWYVRAWNVIDNAKRRFKGSPFRTFIHTTASMEAVIAEGGLTRLSRRSTWTWCIDVYGREARR